MRPYSKDKVSISVERAMTEMDLLQNLAHYYRENNGNLWFNKSNGCWFENSTPKASKLSDVEVIYTVLDVVDGFREKLILEGHQPSAVVDKLLKHIFRIQNIDVIPRFLAIYLAKEDM